jgi:hypothetical protein
MEMKDIIDLGNKVFDRLIDAYGETAESRTLFLYGITTNTRWSIIGSDHWVLVQADGVFMDFEDPILSDLSQQWLAIRADQEKAETAARLQKFKDEYTRPTPKDGDTFTFWSDGGTFREIRL